MRRLLLLPLAGLATALVVAPGPISGSTTTTAAPTTSAPADLPWPDRRFAPCGALDPDDGVLYAFGGRADDGATHLGDLWALDLGNARRDQADVAAGRRRRRTVSPAGRAQLRRRLGRRSAAVARVRWLERSDARTRSARLRPGDRRSGSSSATRCPAAPARRPRRASQLVVDEARNRVLVFGGTNGSYFDDLWSLSLDSLSLESRRRTRAPPPLARRTLDGDRHPTRRAVAVRRNPPRRRSRRPLAARPRHRDVERDRAASARPAARRHVLVRR